MGDSSLSDINAVNENDDPNELAEIILDFSPLGPHTL